MAEGAGEVVAVSGRLATAARSGWVLAAASGLLLPLAFAPYGLPLLAPLSLAGLFVLWHRASPREAAWRGLWFGLGSFGVGIAWVRESFRFSQADPAVAVVLTALLVAAMALYPAGTGYALGRLLKGRSDVVRLAVGFPAGWVLSEWVRGWFLTGFTWLQVGYSQTDTALAGVAPLLGVYGVGWAVAFTAGVVALAVVAPRRLPVWGGLCAILWAGAWWSSRVDWTEPAGPPLTVVLVQGNVSQDQKWLPENRQATLDRYLELTRPHWGADLVVWPETAVPDLLHRAQTFLDALQDEAAGHGTELLTGVPSRDPVDERYRNTVVALGTRPGAYHKRHLVPFGEYLPGGAPVRALAARLRLPLPDFAPGADHQPPLLVAGQPVGVSICYEDAFGEEVARALPEATLLVNVSNDAWFGDTAAPHQHLQMARMRALESGRYLARGTNTGVSALIGPDGAVAARAPQFEAHTLRGTVVPRSGATPFVVLGDAAVAVGAALVLLAAGWPGRRTT